MTATYTSTQVSGGTVPSRSDGAPFWVYASISLTTALTAADIVQMLSVPNGYKVLQTILDTGDLDSGGSPTIKLSLGDTGNASRYLSASTIAQTGGIALNAVSGSTGTVYTPATSLGNPGSTIISVTCETAALTWVNGTVKVAAVLQLDHASFA